VKQYHTQAFQKKAVFSVCLEYMVAHRWPHGVSCLQCGSKDVLFQADHNRWQCRNKHDLRLFTWKTGTIFEHCWLSLDKWLLAIWMVVNSETGVATSHNIHRAICVTPETASSMDRRIRLALGMVSSKTLSDEVEVDQTFVDCTRNIHRRSSLLRGILYNDNALPLRTFLVGSRMKPKPAMRVPGATPGERLSNAVRMVLTVKKEDLAKEKARIKAENAILRNSLTAARSRAILVEKSPVSTQSRNVLISAK
jgi:hypothetical protein